ncbi:MAG TPA: competence protein TfoX [Rhodospirillales bacterium]|nr:competence protein TfoX [Rhodospirillales bacterium]
MRIADLRNLGPVTERQLAEVGIGDVETLRRLGACEAWARLKWRFPREINIVALYALEGALTDTHWNRLPPARKAELRRFATRGREP